MTAVAVDPLAVYTTHAAEITRLEGSSPLMTALAQESA